MKRTKHYRLPYFEEGDVAEPIYDTQRWVVIDHQLYGLFSLFGNGVIEGWDIVLQKGLNAKVSNGSGIIDFVSLRTNKNKAIKLPPNSKRYLYACLLHDRPYTEGAVNFRLYSSKITKSNSRILLAEIETGQNEIKNIDTSERQVVGITEDIISKIANHKHSGKNGDPDKIDLSNEVKGILPLECMPKLDASIVNRGVINKNQLPSIDHNDLVNKGEMTHEDIDDFIELIKENKYLSFGQEMAVEILNLSTIMIRKGYDISDSMKNQIIFSVKDSVPSMLIDENNTDVDIDILDESLRIKCDSMKEEQGICFKPVNVKKGMSNLVAICDYDIDGSVFIDFKVSCVNGFFETIELGKFRDLINPISSGEIMIKIDIFGDGFIYLKNFALMYS